MKKNIPQQKKYGHQEGSHGAEKAHGGTMRGPLSIRGQQHCHTDSWPLKAALYEIMFMKQL